MSMSEWWATPQPWSVLVDGTWVRGGSVSVMVDGRWGLPEARPKPVLGKRGWVEDGAYAAAAPGAVSRVRLPPQWAVDAGMRHCHLNVGLRELVTVDSSGTKYTAGSLETRLEPVTAWNVLHPEQPLTVHVRLHVGSRTPAHWLIACGGVTVTDSNFGKRTTAPRWWVPEYRMLYEAAMVVLAPVVDGLDVIGSVNAPGAAYFYPEPFLLFPNSLVAGTTRNGDNLLAAGWNDADHRAFMLWFPTIGAVFKRTVVYLALNPAPFVSTTGGAGIVDVAFMRDVADVLLATMPAGLAGLENYSAREAWTTGRSAYPQMYDLIASKASVAWTSVQLARPHEVAATFPDTRKVWPDVATWWATKGGHAVETTGAATLATASAPLKGIANDWPRSYIGDALTLTVQGILFANNPTPDGRMMSS